MTNEPLVTYAPRLTHHLPASLLPLQQLLGNTVDGVKSISLSGMVQGGPLELPVIVQVTERVNKEGKGVDGAMASQMTFSKYKRTS